MPKNTIYKNIFKLLRNSSAQQVWHGLPKKLDVCHPLEDNWLPIQMN